MVPTIAGKTGVPIDSCSKAVLSSLTAWKAKAPAAIHSKLEQSTAAFIQLNCLYTVQVAEHARW